MIDSDLRAAFRRSGALADPVDVVISGAGISARVLPVGDAVKQMVWDAVVESLTDAPTEQMLLVGVAGLIRDGDVRLEPLVQSLTAGDERMRSLRGVYDFMNTGPPQPEHRFLAGLEGTRQFTLNMDTLLESAGCQDVIHLHGRWNKPDTIKTTTDDYLNGLDQTIHSGLLAAIAGSHVLVVGYSGRDLDVMPLFRVALPRRLTWIQHQSEPGGRGELAPEVTILLKDLADRGVRLNCGDGAYRGDTGKALEMLYQEACRRVGRSPEAISFPGKAATAVLKEEKKRRRSTFVAALANQLGRVPLDVRLLAAADACFAAGANAETVRLLRGRRLSGVLEVRRRRLCARAARRCGDPGLAWRLLILPPPRGMRIGGLGKNLGELAALAYRSRVPWVGTLLDRLVIRFGPRLVAFLGLTHASVIRAMARQMDRAHVYDDWGRVRRLLKAMNFDPSNWESFAREVGVGATAQVLSTWADCETQVGNFELAILLTGQQVEVAHYAHPEIIAEAYWRRSVAFGRSGRWLEDPSMAEAVDRCLSDARDYCGGYVNASSGGDRSRGSAETSIWVLSGVIEWLFTSGRWGVDPTARDEVQNLVAQLNELLERPGVGQYAAAAAHLTLAGVATCEGVNSQAIRHLSLARRACRANGMRIVEYLHYADIIEAYAHHLGGVATTRDVRRLRLAQRFFQSHGSLVCVARTEILSRLLEGETIAPDKAFVWHSKGWLLEAAVARHCSWGGRLIWQF